MTSTGFEDAKTAKVNGTTLAYREEGEGEPVIFVHGGISDLRVWSRQLPEVGRSYRAIAYSRRFARPNEKIDPGADDPMLPHVEDLVTLLGELGAAPAHLVGNSGGAFICLLAGIRHPEVVRTLVLEEPPVLSLFVSSPPRPWELLRLFATRPRTGLAIFGFATRTMAPLKKAFERGEDDEEVLRTFVRGVGGEGAFEQIPEARLRQMLENLSELRAWVLGAGFPPLGHDEVRGVRTPTLLLTGERSPAFLLRLTDRLEDLLPVVERREIPHASHGMHEENAPAVNEAIVEFLGRQRDEPASP